MRAQFAVLERIFPLSADFEIGLASYSMLLSLIAEAHDVPHIIAAMKAGKADPVGIPDLLPMFVEMDTEVIRAAFGRTLGSRNVVAQVAGVAGSNHDSMKQAWPQWKKSLQSVYRDFNPDTWFLHSLPIGDLA